MRIGRTSTGRPDTRRREIVAGAFGLFALLVIGYLSFTSSDGLPWESGYELTVEVPNAERLAPDNEVSIGGTRVGRVVEVEAVPAEGDKPTHASVRIKLTELDERLPVDTTVSVRPDSVLGASYLELRPGHSEELLAEGDAITLDQAERTTQLTDLFDLFDERTKRDFQLALKGLGGGLAGRGTALNQTIGSFAESMPRIERVSAALAAGETRLADFIDAYARAADEFGAAAPELAGAVRGAATTFGAIASEADAMTATLEALAPAERATASAFAAARPALDQLAAAMTDLRPAAPYIQPALRAANDTLGAGTPAMNALNRMSPKLDTALGTLGQVTRDPATDGAVRKLTEGVNNGAELVETLRAAQEGCNAVTLWATNLGELWGGTGAGSGPSHALIGLGTAHMGALFEQVQNPRPSPNVGMNYISRNNDEECEAGNEPYVGQQTIGNPPGLQPSETYDTYLPEEQRIEAREAGLLDPPPWKGAK